MIDADTYALSYKATWAGTCNGPDGKRAKVPRPGPFGQHLGPQRRQMEASPRREFDRRSEESGRTRSSAQKANKVSRSKDVKTAANAIRLLTPLLRRCSVQSHAQSEHRRSRQGRTRVMGSMEHMTPRSSTL